MAQTNILQKHPRFFICLLLCGITLAPYLSVAGNSYVNYDDDLYVTENPHVLSGLTLKNIVWAFSTGLTGNWHPLTWLSLMADATFFGHNAGPAHMVSLFVHLANTLLLFFILLNMTGALWKCAFVAALFGLHPMHVESVAWIAERKDVLSGFFWLLTMGAYVRYVKKRGLGRLCAVVGFFAAGLMTKPMLVTLPFVLLLLDWWPLRRIDFTVAGVRGTLQKLFLEKWPLFALSAASAVITCIVQQKSGAVQSFVTFPLGMRMANALLSYGAYCWKLIAPVNLSVMYPYPDAVPVLELAMSVLFLAAVSIVSLKTARRLPFLTVGWLWYLGALVPVIGLVQAGAQAMADRYSYIPFIGLSMMIAWGLPAAAGRLPFRRTILASSAGAFVCVMMFATARQVGFWKDGVTLFSHAIACTRNNIIASYNLGHALLKQGNTEAANAQFTEMIRLFNRSPQSAVAHNSLGALLVSQGKPDEAVPHFQEALRQIPRYSLALYNLGSVLLDKGRTEEAVRYLSKAVEVDPDLAGARNNLGMAYQKIGRIDDAIVQFTRAIELGPDDAKMQRNCGNAYLDKGDLNEAIAHYESAINLKSDFFEVYNSLGIAFARQGRLQEAIGAFRESLQLNPAYELARKNLETAQRNLQSMAGQRP